MRQTCWKSVIATATSRLSATTCSIGPEFDPSDGIRLQFAKATVHIIGRNLNAEARPHLRLFEGVTRGRATWIKLPDDPTTMEAPKEATVMEEVEVK